jgi:hypothetical protein
VLFEVASLGYRDLFLWLIRNGADHKKKDGEGQSLEEHLKELESIDATRARDMLAFFKEHVVDE